MFDKISELNFWKLKATRVILPAQIPHNWWRSSVGCIAIQSELKYFRQNTFC